MLRLQFVPQQVKHTSDEIVQIKLSFDSLPLFEHCPDTVDHLGSAASIFEHVLERFARFLNIWLGWPRIVPIVLLGFMAM